MCTELTLHRITNEVSARMKTVLGARLQKIILYGSYARGDYDSGSDIDLMVLAEIGPHEMARLQREIDKISSVISLKNDITVSISLKDKQLFDARVGILPFYQRVIGEGREVYGIQ